MSNIRKTYTDEFKAKVALEILKGEKTLSEVCSEYSVHPTQGKQWRDRLQSGAKELYSKQESERIKELEAENERLCEALGRKDMENIFLKKN